MAGETIITIVGNLTADPELRYTQNGLPVANFTIASTPRSFDRQTNEWKDEEALFLRASVWREFAEQVAASLRKGMRVIATGRLKQRSYQDKEGANKTAIELEIDEIGPSLRYATAVVTKAVKGQGAQGQQNAQQQPAQGYGPPAGGGYGAPQGPPQGMPQQGGYPGQNPEGYPGQQVQQVQPQQGYPQQQQPVQQPPAQQPGYPPQQGYQQPAANPAYGDDTPF